MASYYRLSLGLTLVLVGVAVAYSRQLPGWTAVFAVLAGLAFLTDGIGVAYSGFTDATVPNLVSWASLVIFAVTTAVAAWRRPHRTPTPA
jgi:Na+-transporting methylmalonyl-CoA/oxaloacetate decarboxylase gamma subunit